MRQGARTSALTVIVVVGEVSRHRREFCWFVNFGAVRFKSSVRRLGVIHCLHNDGSVMTCIGPV